MPLCFGSAFRNSCNLTIWTSGAPLEAFQEHKPRVNILRCLSLWPGYCIIRYCSAAPTKRRIIVPTEEEDNSTLAFAGPKSSHHLWQRWWGRDCRSPEFVCWTWSPAQTTEITSQHMLQWKRSLIKTFFFFVHCCIIFIPAMFCFCQNTVHKKRKKKKKTGGNATFPSTCLFVIVSILRVQL